MGPFVSFFELSPVASVYLLWEVATGRAPGMAIVGPSSGSYLTVQMPSGRREVYEIAPSIALNVALLPCTLLFSVNRAVNTQDSSNKSRDLSPRLSQANAILTRRGRDFSTFPRKAGFGITFGPKPASVSQQT